MSNAGPMKTEGLPTTQSVRGKISSDVNKMLCYCTLGKNKHCRARWAPVQKLLTFPHFNQSAVCISMDFRTMWDTRSDACNKPSQLNYKAPGIFSICTFRKKTTLVGWGGGDLRYGNCLSRFNKKVSTPFT